MLPMRGFTGSDPIRLLAHKLDFWVPSVTRVMEGTCTESFPVVENGGSAGPAVLEDGPVLVGATVGNPRCGGELWAGEGQATEATCRTVEAADADGRRTWVERSKPR